MRTLLLAAALLLAVPAASAHHWEIDWDSPDNDLGDSGCDYTNTDCGLAYLCTGGAPPQVVDLVLYCALRASGEAVDVVLALPRFAYAWADFATFTVEDAVGGILCSQVWSGWCTIPDPVDQYPLDQVDLG